MKTKIVSLSHDDMFKAVFSNNKHLLAILVQAILDYFKMDIKVNEDDLKLKRNELDVDNSKDKRLICDYIIKVSEDIDLNMEINRINYQGITERNLTYSFKIFYDHFKTGDNYHKFKRYKLFQVNLNNYHNPNGKCINCFYLIDVNDISNFLSNNISILNIDIASCYDLVYNNSKLEEISVLHAIGAMLCCDYLEDISYIFEKGLIKMDKEYVQKLLDDIKNKSNDKKIYRVPKLEKTIEDRYKLIAGMAWGEAEEVTTKKVTKEVTEEVTENMIKTMLNEKMPYEQISKISGYSVDKIKKLENNKA